MIENPYALRLGRYSTHSVVLDLIGTKKKVLDVGCNDGYIGSLADKSNTFYGVDYLENSVIKTLTIYKDAVTYNLNTLEPLPWKEKFDVIIVADVLEHLIEPEKVLAILVDRYLKSGGAVILSVPNIANWSIRLNLLFGKFDYTQTGILDKTHLHFYTYKSATFLAAQAGLTIEKELAGSSYFGRFIKWMPTLKSLFATSIILYAKK